METHNEESKEPQYGQSQESNEPQINQAKLELYLENLRFEQNLSMGIAFGLAAAVLAAGLWALITILTERQFGFMAIGLGFVVGYAVRLGGKGIDMPFGITGAVLSIFGCLLGNFFSIVGFISKSQGLGFFETLSLIDLSSIPELMAATFSPVDLLFYGLAVYLGYKTAFRQITEQELLANAVG